LVRSYEVGNANGDRQAIHVASGLDFSRYIGGHIGGPLIVGIERDYPDRVFVLAGKKVGNDCFKICRIYIGFAVNRTGRKPVNNKVGCFARAIGRNPRRPASVRHVTHPLQLRRVKLAPPNRFRTYSAFSRLCYHSTRVTRAKDAESMQPLGEVAP
jgi:hypothetical protein